MSRMAKNKAKKTPALKDMVQETIGALKEPGGSSMHEIKKVHGSQMQGGF